MSRDRCHIYSMYWASGQTVPPLPICFGYLYNWFTVDDSRELTSSVDWTVPTETQYDGLITYAGGTTVAGGHLKDSTLIFWNTPNAGASNTYGFRAKGNGERNATTGAFVEFKSSGDIWTSTPYPFNPTTQATLINFNNSTTTANTPGGASMKIGLSIRLTKDATGLSDGVTTTYTGNDGKTYNAIVINELYWTTENLEETLYRDLSTIPNVTDNTTWAELIEGGLCLYDNDLNNVCKLPTPVPAEQPILIDTHDGVIYTPNPPDCSGLSFPVYAINLSKYSIAYNFLGGAEYEDDISEIVVTGINKDAGGSIKYNGSEIVVGDVIDFSSGSIEYGKLAYSTSFINNDLLFRIRVDGYDILSDEVTRYGDYVGCS